MRCPGGGRMPAGIAQNPANPSESRSVGLPRVRENSACTTEGVPSCDRRRVRLVMACASMPHIGGAAGRLLRLCEQRPLVGFAIIDRGEGGCASRVAPTGVPSSASTSRPQAGRHSMSCVWNGWPDCGSATAVRSLHREGRAGSIPDAGPRRPAPAPAGPVGASRWRCRWLHTIEHEPADRGVVDIEAMQGMQVARSAAPRTRDLPQCGLRRRESK